MTNLPLLLLHAFPVDSRMWQEVRAPIAERTRLITPDQRGLGRSPLPDTDREPSLDDAARDVLALLDKLELDRVLLGGCSMGGYLSMALLRLAPERVAGLILIDTKATEDTDEARAKRLAVAERAEADGVTGWLADTTIPALLGAQTREKRPEVADRVRELIEAQPPSGIAWAQRAMAGRPDSTETLRAAGLPALIVVGEDDQLTPVAAARGLHDALPGSELVVVPGAGHLTPIEAPAEVASAITGWLG